MGRPATIGELRRVDYAPRTVKEEMRGNLLRMLKAGEATFPGVVGYDRTVIPAIQNAILARHDFILLGLRGQAKTRLLRGLATLLDEAVPVVPGCEINDDPMRPFCKSCKARIAKEGDALAIGWLAREDRYREKLATPDVTIADLIGDIDPIKAATLRLTYADEDVIHYGIIPKTNRGIFAINELPDLAPRIQVGLLNILEERDLQIRGFPVRMPLDIVMVFSANPEDYTNRGNIITPLKDRIDSQVLTHYPASIEDAMRITAQEAWVIRGESPNLKIPFLYRELIEEIAMSARKSEFVDQASGVSARLSISALECLASNMERRAWKTGDRTVWPRIGDLWALFPALSGKLELVYEGEQEGALNVAHRVIGKAVQAVFARHFPAAYGEREAKPAPRARPAQAKTEDRKPERETPKDDPDDSPYQEIVAWFNSGKALDLSDELPQEDYRKALQGVPGLSAIVEGSAKPADEDEAAMLMEFLLEGLHRFSLIGREDRADGYAYRDMLKSMFDQMKAGRPSE